MTQLLQVVFSDATQEEHIPSQWRQWHQVATTSNAQQTDPRTSTAAQTQHPSRSDADVQAQDPETGDCDDPELAALLEDEDAAAEAQQSALEGGGDDGDAVLSHRHTLNPFDAKQGHANKADLAVMALAWHPTTLSVAAAFGKPFGVGFCALPGLLAIWHLSREQFDPGKPQCRMETDCALQAVAYNAAFPALIAAGSANGDIYVWDMARDDDDREVGKSGRSALDIMHREAVRSIAWVHSGDEGNRHAERSKAFLICTVGGEGRVLLWRWHACRHPVYGVRVLDLGHKVSMGLQSAAFPTQTTTKLGLPPSLPVTRIAADTVLKVGSETGHICDCSLRVTPSDVADWEALTLPDAADKRRRKGEVEWRNANAGASVHPSRAAKLPHTGPVTVLDLCPAMQQVLLSAGLDGRVRLSGPGLQELLLLEPFDVGVTAGAWSPHNPALFLVGSQDGRLAVYDLASSRFKAVETLDVIGLDQPISAIAFPRGAQHDGWFAVSNVDTVSVYRLSRRFSGGPKRSQRNALHLTRLLTQSGLAAGTPA